MKFLILTHYISPDIKGGSYDVAYGMARSLAKYSEVQLISFMPKGLNKNNNEKINDIIVQRIPEKIFSSLNLRFDYDLVIIHSPIMFLKYILSKSPKKPIFYVVHSPAHIERYCSINKRDIKYYFLKLFEKFIYIRSDAILFGSSYIKKIANLSNKEKNKSFTIPFGINKPNNLEIINLKEIKILEEINKDINNGFKFIFSIRGLKPRTGIENLIKAFKFLNDQKVKLLIAGTGPLFNELNELIEKLNLENRIILLGCITDEFKYKLFSISYLSVIPSIKLEGFGISLLESMYMGCPVIISPVGGMYEYYINNSMDDLIINTPEPESIARKIVQLLQDPCKVEYFKNKSISLAKKLEYNELSEVYLKRFSYILEYINSKS